MDIEQQIIAYLNEHDIPYSKRNNEIHCRCLTPEHNDSTPSFYINTELGVYHCFGCKDSGRIEELLDIKVNAESRRYSLYKKYLNELEQSELIPTASVGLPEHILPPKSNHQIPDDWRNIPKELWDSLGAYICDRGRYKGRVVLPSYDPFSDFKEPNGFDARIIELEGLSEPSVPKAKYLRPSIIKTKETFWFPKTLPDYLYKGYVVITEGVIDAISLLQLGEPAVANYGLTPITPKKASQLYALGITEVKLGLDSDKAGFDATPTLSRSLKASGLVVGKPLQIVEDMLRAGIKDYNEYLQYLTESQKGD